MPENDLNIRVNVDAKNLNELNAQLKEAQKNFKAARPGSAEFQQASKDVAETKNQIYQLNSAVKEQTTSFKTYQQTVRESRQEARLMRFAVVELLHTFDGMTTAVSAFSGMSEKSTASLKTFTGAVSEGVNSGLGMSFAMKTLGGSFAAVAGPVGIAVGLLTVLGSVMGNTKKQVDDLTEAIRKQRVTIGQTSAQERISEIDKRISELSVQRATATYSLGERVGAVVRGIVTRTGGRPTGPALGALQAEQEENALIAERQTLVKQLATEEKKVTEEKQKQFQLDLAHRVDVRQGIASQTFTTLEYFNRYRMGRTPMKSFRELSAGGFEKVRGGPEPKLNVEGNPLDEFMQSYSIGLKPLTSGLQAVGAAFEENVIAKLGKATSVFQIFAQSVLKQLVSMIAEMAVFAGLAAILDIVTGGALSFGQVFGGLSGIKIPGLGGGAGASSINPVINSFSGSAAMQSAGRVQVYGRLDRGDIYLSSVYGAKDYAYKMS